VSTTNATISSTTREPNAIAMILRVFFMDYSRERWSG
jgi:hypothetical protein